jgi:hypothetical protein
MVGGGRGRVGLGGRGKVSWGLMIMEGWGKRCRWIRSVELV